MFELDQFIADCQAALKADRSRKSIREVVARAISDPNSVMKALARFSHSVRI